MDVDPPYALVDRSNGVESQPIELCHGHSMVTNHIYAVLERPEESIADCDCQNPIYDVIASGGSTTLSTQSSNFSKVVQHETSESSCQVLSSGMSVSGIKSQNSEVVDCGTGLVSEKSNAYSRESFHGENTSLSDTYNHLLPKSKVTGIFGIKKLVALATKRCSKMLACALCFHIVVLTILSAVLLFNVVEVSLLKRTIRDLKALKCDMQDANSTENQICGKENCERMRKSIENLTQLHERIEKETQLQEQALSVLGAFNGTIVDRLFQLEEFMENISNLGQPSRPAASCAALYSFNPSSPSGYYWVRTSSGYSVHVYCNMTLSCGGVTGGWTRVAELNVTNSTTLCPGDLRLRYDSSVPMCSIKVIYPPACSSTTFSVRGIQYSAVCGRIKAYQGGTPSAFHDYPKIDGIYVDGVSLTYGKLRQHIWTFAMNHQHYSNCPCYDTNFSETNEFVGEDYFCDGSASSEFSLFNFTNPLWDGEGCSHDDKCCTFNNPPWFHKHLSQPTSNDIEMRVCSDDGREDEDIGIAAFEIYIQ